eukprot:scaffold75238_cov28-Phaeocystis_antarctica.AAC.1
MSPTGLIIRVPGGDNTPTSASYESNWSHDSLRPLTLLIEAPERAAKHPGVLRRGCLAVGYI